LLGMALTSGRAEAGVTSELHNISNVILPVMLGAAGLMVTYGVAMGGFVMWKQRDYKEAWSAASMPVLGGAVIGIAGLLGALVQGVVGAIY